MELKGLIERFLAWEEGQGFSLETIRSDSYKLKMLVDYLEQRGTARLEQINPDLLRDFQEDLSFRTTRKGFFWTPGTRNTTACTIRNFLSWLKKEDWIAIDLTEAVCYAKTPQRLPRNILTVKEMELLLSQPDTTTHKGYQHRLMMELLYATGLRRKEACTLEIQSADIEQGYLHVREGKGNKDRVVPLGRQLCEMIGRYIHFVRPSLTYGEADSVYLFPGKQKRPMDKTTLNKWVKYYAKKGKLAKRVSPHMFRHACATHMLANGAPIRHVQELLGHARVDTTQIYAHVTINELKKAHAKYHPREKMLKKKDIEKEGESGQ